MAGCGSGSTADPVEPGIRAAEAATGGADLSIVTLDSSARAEAVFALLPPADFLDEITRAAWEGSGLRVVRVPEADLARVRGMLEGSDRGLGHITRQWLSPGAAWVEAVRESGSPEPRVVALHDSRFRAAPGWLRLLVRCWPEPILVGAAEGGGEAAERAEIVLRVELVPQAADDPRTHDRDAAWERSLRPTAARPRSAEEQGLVIQRLRGALLVKPGEAIAIVYETPGVAWRSPAAGMMVGPGTNPPPPDPGESSEVPMPEEPAASLGEVRRGGASVSEPSVPARPAATPATSSASMTPGVVPLFRIPILGELLLGDGPEPTASRRVLLIVPRGGREFRLLPG